jgi:hypothetical protein
MGGMDGRARRGKHDYYDANVFYEGHEFMPTTFEGMSGGGFWFIRIGRNRQAKEQLQMKDRFFSGVVFFELAHDNGVVSAIRTHGRKSVFGYAIDELILGGKPA